MTNRRIKIVTWHAWGHGRAGYLKRCRNCGSLIYLKRDYDDKWRPYESWAAGNVGENEWRRHDCSVIGTAA